MNKTLFFLILFLSSFSNWAVSTAQETAIKSATTKKFPQVLRKPLKVAVIFMLNSIISVDEKDQSFEADIDLTLNWHDSSLAFDPIKESSNILNYEGKNAEAKLETIWSPEITIANVETIENMNPSLMISLDGSVTEIRRIRAVFRMKTDLRAFPFDTQYLYFDLEASHNSIHEIEFVQNQSEINRSGIRAGVRLKGWNLLRTEFENVILKSTSNGFYPRFEAIIVMDRIPGPHLFSFAPLFLIMLAPTLLTLYNKESTLAARLTAWGAALLTLIAVSFSLDQKYPALEADSILPQIISIVLVYQFIMILITITVVNPLFVNKIKNPFLMEELLKYLKWAVPAGFALLIVTRVLLSGTQL